MLCTIVQSYSPGGANVYDHLIHDLLGPLHSTHYPKWQLDQFSRFYTTDPTFSLYVTLHRIHSTKTDR